MCQEQKSTVETDFKMYICNTNETMIEPSHIQFSKATFFFKPKFYIINTSFQTGHFSTEKAQNSNPASAFETPIKDRLINCMIDSLWRQNLSTITSLSSH